jgi:hypothetical protein
VLLHMQQQKWQNFTVACTVAQESANTARPCMRLLTCTVTLRHWQQGPTESAHNGVRAAA